MKIYQIDSERYGYDKSWELQFVINNSKDTSWNSILISNKLISYWVICRRTILKYNKD